MKTKMANDDKSDIKVNIISNEKITNFSDYLKASNLTSKKDILFKGLSNNVALKNKFNLSNILNTSTKKEVNSLHIKDEKNLSNSIEPNVSLSHFNYTYNLIFYLYSIIFKIKKEIVSQSDSSSEDEEKDSPKDMV